MTPRRLAAGRRPPALRLLKGATIGIVGTGQVGGSLIRRLSRYRPDMSLAAFDLDRSLAARVGRHAHFCDSLADLVGRSDLVIVAVPVQATITLLPRLARLARRRRSRRRLIVCDTATVKATVVAAAQHYESDFDFVGLHPLAGIEVPGWDAGDAAMFDQRAVVICPARARATARDRAVRVAKEVIALIGGVPVMMRPDEHDRLVAEGIGLPHILAFAAARLGGLALEGAVLKAGSWRSLTRVAASSTVMVAGFLHQNRAHQRRVLAEFIRHLGTLERALRRPSGAALERQLGAWQRRRRSPSSGRG
ncbi:MAG: prephenate dehydrogenase/arogenate dehydrogenase family protein [Acidobacteriota bacterium]